METCNRACESEPLVWPFKRNLFRFVLFNGAICSVSAFYKGNLKFFFNVLFPAFFVVRGVTPQTKKGLPGTFGANRQHALAFSSKTIQRKCILRHRLKSLKSSSFKNYVTCLPAMLPLCHAQQLRKPRPHFSIQLVLHVSRVRSLIVWTSTALLFFLTFPNY